MKKHVIYLFLLISIQSFGQDKPKSNYLIFNNSYPIPLGDNFVNNPFGDKKAGFRGIDAFELGYVYNLYKDIYIGFELKYSLLKRPEIQILDIATSKYFTLMSLNSEIINPSFVVNYHYNIGPFRIIPQINLGYSLYRFYRKTDIYLAYFDTNNAFTMSSILKMHYIINNNLSVGISLAYEYSWLEKDDATSFSSYNQHLQFLYPGIGVEIKI